MSEPLTKAHFDEWRTSEFVPHIQAEMMYEKKVDKLDTQLAMWLRVVSVGLAMGGAVLGIFLWILLEKNMQMVEMQKAIVAISAEHKQVIATLEQQGRELTRQAVADQQVMSTILEVVKQQAHLHGQLNGGKR